MMKRLLLVGLAVSALGLVQATPASADEWDKKTVLTFNQPFEIPGHVLPAGTYIFKLADTLGDRHIVQVFSADGKTLIATVMTIPDHRLKTSTDTVIRFNEVPRGAPETIRAWFYPGNSIGQEFVYPKPRAVQLAKMANTPVPATAVDTTVDIAMLKSAPIVAITPDQRELPVAAVIQTRPLDAAATEVAQPDRASSVVPATLGIEQEGQTARTSLPETSTTLTLIVLIGCVGICLGALLMQFRRPVPVANR
jgi:hypothetical protein